MADPSSTAEMPGNHNTSHDPLSDSLEYLLASRQSHQDDTTDINCCCGEIECPSQKQYEQSLQKAESDARLAAEIGQTLLHKHERYTMDAQAIQAELEQKIKLISAEKKELERLNHEAKIENEQAKDDRVRAIAERERSKKMVEAVQKDLEIISIRCKNLEDENQAKKSEIAEIKALQVIVAQSHSMEQTMQSKVDDLLQELSSVQKNEAAVESKYRKLKSRYEALHASYHMTKRQMKELESSSEDYKALAWLKESNNKMRQDLLHISKGSPNKETQGAQLISLIQELATANNKLKGEILNQQETISALSSRVQEAENDTKNDEDEDYDHIHHNAESRDNFSIPMPKHKHAKSTDMSSQLSGSWTSSILATSPPRFNVNVPEDVGNHKPQPISLLSKLEEAQKSNLSQSLPGKPIMFKKPESMISVDTYAGDASINPQRSTSTPMKTKFGSPLSQSSIFVTPSPPHSPSYGGQELRHPYKVLYDLAFNLQKRLSGTEIRILNRRLHRAFDMLKLTDLSNSIIENVNQDIQALDSRFSWVQQGVKDQEQPWAQETISLGSFFVMVKLVQDLLAEIGNLRTTLNSLQVEYVNKVNENQSFVEKALEEQSDSSKLDKSESKQTDNTGTFAWLSSIIYRTSGSVASVKNSDDDSVHSSTEEISEAGNTSSISYLSNSIYRIANTLQGGQKY
ncbi:hypothetical protein K450DRAFT_259849 [Umbelopsis ramanniana AG]|uniref:Uncharacterized protein n=1 Tax=Umbelopsis ramanniana AG TaxID=1314678 RepID=A0AAD5HAK8_UMBRA|nr:uncharacterized protein K450DRAFT_259849 [Umbelopsis ramanniana AG]KAI8575849.1 hypothetical protein K450DRAFT_259849 [Umbelopsis ramanniana AG]